MVSDEYIMMCREAKELQDEWKPKQSDLVYTHKNDVRIINFIKDLVVRFQKFPFINDPFINEAFYEFDDHAYYLDYTKKNMIWLPRQEDLIEIMENNWEHGRCELIGHFHNFSWNYIHNRCKKYDFNELWLMVLMEYIYNKTWNGNGWVKL